MEPGNPKRKVIYHKRISYGTYIPVCIRQMLAPKRTDVFDVLYRIQYCTYELMIGCFGSGDEHV